MGAEVTVVTSCTDSTAARARVALGDGVRIVVDEAPVDTRFGFDRDASSGPQRLSSRASRIDRLPHGIDADVLHLAPVFAELGPALLGGDGPARWTVATPQGLLRTAGPDGKLGVDLDGWPPGDFADAIVVSHDEFAAIDAAGLLAGFTGWVYRTLGPDGAELWRHGARVAACRPVDDVEVTAQRTIGAGDVFAAAAFVAIATGAEPVAALEVGVAAATAYVRRTDAEPEYFDGFAAEVLATVRLDRVPGR